MTADQIRERITLTRALMEHPAWALLVRDWQEEIELLKNQLVYQAAPSEEVRGVWRGKLDVLERLNSLSKILDAIEQGLEANEESGE